MAVDYHIAVGFKGIAVSPLTFYSNSNNVVDSEGNFKFSDPFNKAEVKNPVYYVLNNKIKIWPGYGDGYSTDPWYNTKYVTGVRITSVMNPGLTTLFDDGSNPGRVWREHQQNELVQIAARKMTGNIESSNYEISQKEVENNM